MRPQLGVEAGRLLFRMALSDTANAEGPVRDAVERFVPKESAGEVWRSARESAVGFVGGTADAEAQFISVVVDDGGEVGDAETRRIRATDALLANWVAVSRPTEPIGVLLVHCGESRTTARFVKFRTGIPLRDLGAAATELTPVEFGLARSVDAVLDRLGQHHHDRTRPELDAPLLRAVLEFGLGLCAAGPDGEVRWRGPHAARLWQPMTLSSTEYARLAAAGRLAPLVEEAAGLAKKAPLRVVVGGGGAFFPDVVEALAGRFDRSSFVSDPSAVARGAARWREGTQTFTPVIASLPAVESRSAAPVATPPWAR